MNRLEVRFDRVFDVVRASRWPDKRYTHFGFESDGKRVVDVSVPGWTTVEAGMTVIAVLRNANDWKSLLGWVDCSNGNIACEAPNGYLVASLLFMFFVLVFPLRANEIPWQATLIIWVALGGGALSYLYLFVKSFRIKRELLSIRDALGVGVRAG